MKNLLNQIPDPPEYSHKDYDNITNEVAKLRQSPIVLKISGKTAKNPEIAQNIATQLIFLTKLGIQIILVHGAGPQLTDLLGEKKLDENGERITPPKKTNLVRDTSRKVSWQIIQTLKSLMPEPLHSQISYIGHLGINGSIRDPKTNASGNFNYPETLSRTLEQTDHLGHKSNKIIVIGHVGHTDDNELININADNVAGGIAESIQASKLLILGTTNGILDPNQQTIGRVEGSENIEDLIEDGTINEGMIPKAKIAETVASKGTDVHIMPEQSKTYPDLILQELLNAQGVPNRSTMITQFHSQLFSLPSHVQLTLSKCTKLEEADIKNLLTLLNKYPNILQRTKTSILKTIENWIIIKNENELTGCGEIKSHSKKIWELGAIIGENGRTKQIIEKFNELRVQNNIQLGCAIVPIKNKESLKFFSKFATQKKFPKWFTREIDERIYFEWK